MLRLFFLITISTNDNVQFYEFVTERVLDNLVSKEDDIGNLISSTDARHNDLGERENRRLSLPWIQCVNSIQQRVG
jgi:hypothetical protein